MKKPKSIWIILDPLDGPHTFTSYAEAIRIYKKWEREADSAIDSFWDMSEPLEYTLKGGRRK